MALLKIPKEYVITGAQLRELLHPQYRDTESTELTIRILRGELLGRTRVAGEFIIKVNERL